MGGRIAAPRASPPQNVACPVLPARCWGQCCRPSPPCAAWFPTLPCSQPCATPCSHPWAVLRSRAGQLRAVPRGHPARRRDPAMRGLVGADAVAGNTGLDVAPLPSGASCGKPRCPDPIRPAHLTLPSCLQPPWRVIWRRRQGLHPLPRRRGACGGAAAGGQRVPPTLVPAATGRSSITLTLHASPATTQAPHKQTPSQHWVTRPPRLQFNPSSGLADQSGDTPGVRCLLCPEGSLALKAGAATDVTAVITATGATFCDAW